VSRTVVNIPAANTTNVVPLTAEQAVDGSNVILHLPTVLVGGVAQAVAASQPLPVYNPGTAATALGGTIATGGSAQFIFGGTTPTNGYSISNLHLTEVMYINDVGVGSAAGASIPISALTTFVTPTGYKPPNDVSAYAATTGHPYSARRW